MLINEADEDEESDDIHNEPGLVNSLLENFNEQMIIIEDPTFDIVQEKDLNLSPSPHGKEKDHDAECKVTIINDFIPSQPTSPVKSDAIDPRTGKPSNAIPIQPPVLTDKAATKTQNSPRPFTRQEQEERNERQRRIMCRDMKPTN